MSVEVLFTELCANPLIKQARERLARDLPPTLLYHVPSHTDDVIREAIGYALQDGLSKKQIELLALGAAFHDLGFTVQYKYNEKLGASMAVEAMGLSNKYPSADIDQVRQIISDTELKFLGAGPKQVPTTELSKYLCDADVSNLGRTDFFEKAELYRQELGRQPREFYAEFTLPFLEAHEWHTPAAKKTKQAQKDLNLAELRRRVATM